VCALIQQMAKWPVMMGMNILKKTTDALNEGLITPRLDRFVPEVVRTVYAVGDQVSTPANRREGGPIRNTNPLEGMVVSADFTGVVGEQRAPFQSRSDRTVNTETQSEAGGAESPVRYIPHPLDLYSSEEEPSVYRTASGE